MQAQLSGLALALLATAGLALMAAAGSRLEGRTALQPLAWSSVAAMGLATPLLLGWSGLALGLWMAATAAMLALALARDLPLGQLPQA